MVWNRDCMGKEGTNAVWEMKGRDMLWGSRAFPSPVLWSLLRKIMHTWIVLSFPLSSPTAGILLYKGLQHPDDPWQHDYFRLCFLEVEGGVELQWSELMQSKPRGNLDREHWNLTDSLKTGGFESVSRIVSTGITLMQISSAIIL